MRSDFKSRRQDDDLLINSILPSYHMFESTISKKLIPNEENFKEDPPLYEMSPLNSGGVTPVHTTLPQNPSLLSFPFPAMPELEEGITQTFNQNSADYWESTVLAHVHNLDNLAESNNPMANNLDIKVFFTEEVCQKGVIPNLIDPSHTEYKQGDYIHGYVTIENQFKEPIPFDMVYVAFEGILCVVQLGNGAKDSLNPPTVVKFLNMLDLFASWSYANIDRLVTDSGDPHDWCEGDTDPWDYTQLSIDVKRLFRPHTTYKRFFSFRIPERLLDDNCDAHNLDAHCTLLPTLGRAFNLSSSKRFPIHDENQIKDLSFMDSFIGYSVSARVMGRASQYNHKVDKDKYVLARETSVPLRVLPYSVFPEYKEVYELKIDAYYRAYLKTVEQKIEEGMLVRERMRLEAKTGSSSLPLTPFNLTTSRTSTSGALVVDKLKHMYICSGSYKKGHNIKASGTKFYQHVSAYRKKTITGFSKILGTISLATPKASLKIPYVPPRQFRNPLQGYNTKVRVPIELSYAYDLREGKQTPPEPRSITCDLLLITIRSKKHPIPIEFSHDMCFFDEYVDDMGQKKSDELESFETIVIKTFQDHYCSLVSLMKEIGFNNDAFRVETLLFKGIKSLALVQTKKINLAVPDVKIMHENEKGAGSFLNFAAVPWEQVQSQADQTYNIASKNCILDIDFESCHLKGAPEIAPGLSAFDLLCLVPDFQTCHMSRLYFLRVTVRHKNGILQAVHVPLNIFQ
ncbi:hypothetical protein METBIDRAFT_76420 [Metschnikowia bicuspidata var. bicuspidata NRRL YB-4993]|uniref:Bul1 N-terminal domain-containing protein n=1 Tax=Metschnikowia bicuspidata var. bicuspidata NRRL YB-4993 TaxID=869754 RepID=A0A1A0HHP0_9ASCO|nr:hypothetical protein METBIDRAFT_76420 [Metschnikowia bicuspidata var. bicuspidata NRRL YB-4993]OBA23397.1 hypothetical protein METBIDRAFT_76420 [Metschnikowia bicuspidata var. bicuspidata NRRL YB-4993]